MQTNKITVGFIGAGKSTHRYHSPFILNRSDKFIINSITTDEFGNRKLSKYEFYN